MTSPIRAGGPAASFPLAPPISAALWLNTPGPLTLAQLRGRVVVLHAFQMLCPGCVSHGLPQAAEIRRAFDPDAVAVLGLHSVFEHHEAMTPAALRAFVHEYRLTFPIAVDAPSDPGPLPRTMHAYRMQGTPTLVLIDRCGRVRAQHFGVVADLVAGAEIGQLLAEPATAGI
ncbi:MAG: redoxin domain-containing protein [Verrucomicrobia bacterium]|nr:redoxin domain-containing protein [Verrucomicrobiota bacterium]